MAITTGNAKIKLSFSTNTIFEKICNASALNAKYVAEELNADSLIMSADERYFFDTNIENVVASLAGYFVRISDKTDSYTAGGENIEISFNSRNDFSQVEADILNALAENYIITEILKLWYHSVAPHEILATKYAGESASLDRRLRIALFQFYKPTTNNGFFDCIKVVGAPGKDNIHHINNRSDFILLWRPKDYSTLPDKFSVTFYTSGAETYEVQYPDATPTPKIIPVTDGKGNAVAAQIVFDLTSSANYFADGRLQYTMVADIANPLFVDGYQTVESSDELPFEIWGGPSDSIAKIEAMFIPAYAKLTLADLTDAEIAILQGPALEAAAEAKTQAQEAKTAALNARVAEGSATSAAKSATDAADYANRGGAYAFNTTNDLKDVVEDIETAEKKREGQEQSRKEAEANRVLAEQERNFNFGTSINRADTASAAAEYQAQQAAKERGELAQFVQDLKTAEDRRVEAEELRDKNEDDPITGRIAAENIRVNNENQRITFEVSRQAKETERQQAETARDIAEGKRIAAEDIRQQNEAKRQSDSATAVSNAQTATAEAKQATTAANSAATAANTAAESVEQFKNETTERVDELEIKIDRVFDGGRADSVYGPAVRVINCGGANN